MPTRPRTAGKAAAQLKVAPAKPAADDGNAQGWDEYVAEASRDIEPWRKTLPDGTVLDIGCPTSDQMDALAGAYQTGDSQSMLIALFGAENGLKLMELTGGLPFTVRLKLVRDVTLHFGMSLADLGELSASSS